MLVWCLSRLFWQPSARVVFLLHVCTRSLLPPELHTHVPTATPAPCRAAFELLKPAGAPVGAVGMFLKPKRTANGELDFSVLGIYDGLFPDRVRNTSATLFLLFVSIF